jgi:hypothetical protein
MLDARNPDQPDRCRFLETVSPGRETRPATPARANHLGSMWYGNVPFRPEDNGSAPVAPADPVVRSVATRSVKRSPDFYLPGIDPADTPSDSYQVLEERAIQREAMRLADIFNGAWEHHLNADDVAALIAKGRLMDLTHTFDPVNRWQPKDPPFVPTPAEVNAWSLQGLGHDSCNQWIVIEARCGREGVPYECGTCAGAGDVATPEQRAIHDAWEPTDPPEGDGWQLWETVSEGSPISPVFPTADGLAEWMTTPAAQWGAMGPWTREQADAFVGGPGWAPTFIGSAEAGLVDGVTAVAAL